MALELLKASIAGAPIVKRGDYDYIVDPLTDGIPKLDPKLLNEVADAMMEICRFNCDYIMTIEALGIPITTALSLKTGKPFNIVRKKMYGLPGEVSLQQETGYSRSTLTVNGVHAGDTVVIVDDVVSTGGTLWALVETLKRMQVNISDIVVVLERTDKKAEIERKIGHHIKTLIKVEVVGGKVIVL